MWVNLSIAEIGAIVSALQLNYDSDSPEWLLSEQLVDKVHEQLDDDMFYMWIDEFEIIYP